MVKCNCDFFIDDLIEDWRNKNAVGDVYDSKPIFPSKSINVDAKVLKQILLTRCVGNKITITHNATVREVNLYANSLPCNVWQIWLKWSDMNV